MRGSRAWRVLALIAAVALCGCIVLPIPGDPDAKQRDNIDEHAGETFRAGISTREDVLLALGEPAEFEEDGSWLEYTDVRNLGHWLIAGCGGYVCSGFETSDRYLYRTLLFYLDRQARLREVLNLDSPADFVPEARLLDERFKSAAEPGEGVVEPFVGVEWRVADRWADGALFVTDRAVLFFETPDAGPLYRLALRLPAASIGSVAWGHDGGPQPGQPFALVWCVNGTTEAFAFGTVSSKGTPADSALDRVRTEHFIDIAGWLRPRASLDPKNGSYPGAGSVGGGVGRPI